MQLPPVEVIAAWPPANYTNPSDVRGPTILILTAVFIPLLVILVALRAYTRLRLSKSFGPDDIAIVAAMFPTIGCAALALTAVQRFGWSRHVWDVPTDQLVVGLEIVIAVEILFVCGVSLTKLSMLLLINRIMGAGSNTLRRMSTALMVIVCLDCAIYFVVVLNNCSPVSAYWTLSFGPQNCINEAAHLLAGGIINTTTDICIVLIPIPVVLKLRLPLRQRIVCAMLFGAGFIVCIAAVLRMVYTYQLNVGYDKTWLAYPVWLTATIELYLGIIATSIPTIKPLVARYFPRMLGNSYTNNGQSFSNGIVKSIEHHVELGASPGSETEINRFSSDQISLTKPQPMGIVTAVTVGRASPVPLLPAVSSFSTYKKNTKDTIPVTDENLSVTPWEKVCLPKESLKSLEATHRSADNSGLANSNNVRMTESREGLIEKGIIKGS